MTEIKELNKQLFAEQEISSALLKRALKSEQELDHLKVKTWMNRTRKAEAKLKAIGGLCDGSTHIIQRANGEEMKLVYAVDVHKLLNKEPEND